MIRGRAGIADTDDTETARARLADCLERYVSDPEERRWIEPRLGHLIGLDGPSGDREELFGAWRRFFERVAEHGTTVLVLEDLHWADPGLLDFVESLLEWSRTSPVLVLTMARPELSERRPTWGVGVRSSTVLHLDRLPDDCIEAMVTGYVEGLPPQGLERLVRRAEGIPMYAVETVRMLADRGVLEQVGQSYRVVGELGDVLDVPETLHALVASRIDGLPEDERSLVQDASVAGHTFTVATVCAVTGRAPADLEALLRTLVRKEVLRQDLDPRSPERGQYHFVQSVIHEVAYSTLSKPARRAKHLACARWYESLEEDELAGVVADHYLEAYRAEPGAPDAEEIADHARSWLMKAGARASSLASPEQAYRYAIQALSLAVSPADRAAIHDRAAVAASAAGDKDACFEHLIAASDDYQALGDPAAEARLLCGIARLDHSLERRNIVAARLVDVESRLAEGDRVERVEVLCALADDASHAVRIESALDYSERALVLAQKVEGEESIRPAVASRAFALMMAGRHYEARLFLDAGVEMARRGGSPFEQARAFMYFGVSVMEDDPRASFDAMVDCAAVAAKSGYRPVQGLALANASEGAVDLGEWASADRALREMADLAREGTIDDDGATLTRAMLTAHRGEPAAALDSLVLLESRRSDTWDVVQMHTWFLRVRALCLLLAGDAEAAAEAAASSLELDPAGSNALSSLWVAVQAGSARHQIDEIRAALDATGALRGRMTVLVRATATAVIACLDGAEDHAVQMTRALDAWSGADLPLDHAFATLCAVHVLPAEDRPLAHIERARDYLASLEATSLLRLYDSALG
jgi:hypothetical protein